MSEEKTRVVCECPGCDDLDCNAISGVTCDRTSRNTPENLHILGWRTSNGAWLCPVCSRGLPGRPPPCTVRGPPLSRARKRVPRKYTACETRVEPASSPVWQERGSQLLTFLGTGPKSWPELTAWGASMGFSEQVLRNTMASVDESVVYEGGLWRAVVARGKHEPMPPSPACTLRARLATEAF